MTQRDDKLLAELGHFVRATERSKHPQEHDVLAPLDAAAKQSITARLIAQAQANAAETTRDSEPDAPVRSGIVELASRRRASKWHMTPIALSLGMAAAVMLWLVRAPHLPPAPAKLPTYALQVTNAPAEMRSAPQVANAGDAPITVSATTRLRLQLRPTTAVHDLMGARVFLMSAAGPLRWNAAVTAATSGAMQLQLSEPPAAVLAPAVALIVVGREAELASHANTLATDAPIDDVQRLQLRITPP
jgi:hypothetical protein